MLRIKARFKFPLPVNGEEFMQLPDLSKQMEMLNFHATIGDHIPFGQLSTGEKHAFGMLHLNFQFVSVDSRLVNLTNRTLIITFTGIQ